MLDKKTRQIKRDEISTLLAREIMGWKLGYLSTNDYGERKNFCWYEDNDNIDAHQCYWFYNEELSVRNGGTYTYEAPEATGYTINSWQPFKIEDAFVLLNKIESMEDVERTVVRYEQTKLDGYYCYIGVFEGETIGHGEKITKGYVEKDTITRPKAIIGASLKMIGEYEDYSEVIQS